MENFTKKSLSHIKIAMQYGKICLKLVKSSLQHTKFCLKRTADSLKERFQKVYLRQDFGFLGLQKQALGPSKKVGQKNWLLDIDVGSFFPFRSLRLFSGRLRLWNLVLVHLRWNSPAAPKLRAMFQQRKPVVFGPKRVQTRKIDSVQRRYVAFDDKLLEPKHPPPLKIGRNPRRTFQNKTQRDPCWNGVGLEPCVAESRRR